jgi:hypothetical protein
MFVLWVAQPLIYNYVESVNLEPAKKGAQVFSPFFYLSHIDAMARVEGDYQALASIIGIERLCKNPP